MNSSTFMFITEVQNITMDSLYLPHTNILYVYHPDKSLSLKSGKMDWRII